MQRRTTSSPAHQASQSGTFKKWLLPSLSVFIGILPNFMPDSIKQWAITYGGSSYALWWGCSFILTALVFIVITFRSTDQEARRRKMATVKIDHIHSKTGNTRIESTGKGPFTANTIDSGNDTDLQLTHKGDISIKGINSEKNTTIINNGL